MSFKFNAFTGKFDIVTGALTNLDGGSASETYVAIGFGAIDGGSSGSF